MTLKDVADSAGVHTSTVSRALDDTQTWRFTQETVTRIREAARELGYIPDLVASGLKRGQTKTVGVVVGDLQNPYNAPLIRGISGELEDKGFVALVAETIESGERFERLLRNLMERRVDVIITDATHLGDDEMLTRVVGDQVPVVLAVRSLPGSRYASVLHDDRKGGALAARHLIELGHRRLAQLVGLPDVDTFVRRAQGFREAVASEGLEDRTIDLEAVAPTETEGRRLMHATLTLSRPPTGLFVPSDEMAIGALQAVTERGLSCPKDISVIGYNNVPYGAHMRPALTTIQLPSEAVGRAAAQVALEKITHPDHEPPTITLPSKLIVRESTAPAPTFGG